MYDIEFNENPEMCKVCGGNCCKNMGCSIFPYDVLKEFGKIDKDVIEKMLTVGNTSVDWWGGDPRDDEDIPKGGELLRVFYLRVRNKNATPIDGSWGGECLLWSKENGCSLMWEDRPTGGKSLIPASKPEDCISKIGDTVGDDKWMNAIAWIPYQNVFEELFAIPKWKDALSEAEFRSDAQAPAMSFKIPLPKIDENECWGLIAPTKEEFDRVVNMNATARAALIAEIKTITEGSVKNVLKHSEHVHGSQSELAINIDPDYLNMVVRNPTGFDPLKAIHVNYPSTGGQKPECD